MKNSKMLAVALGAVVVTTSALATPTLVIWDDLGAVATAPAVGGIVVYSNPSFDAGRWSVVISTGESKPALGSATSPTMDLNIQASSLGIVADNLHVSWSDNGFGPFNSTIQAQLSGHVVSGTGAPISYNTYYDPANSVWTTAATPGGTQTLLTTSGTLAPPLYFSTQNGALSQSAFGLTEFVTITSTPGGAYSIDASLSAAPDGGTTVMLLGAALSGLAFLRRKMA